MGTFGLPGLIRANGTEQNCRPMNLAVVCLEATPKLGLFRRPTEGTQPVL